MIDKKTEIISKISMGDFPFLEIDKGIRKRKKHIERWGFKNPTFLPDNKGYTFEYDFTLHNVHYTGNVYIGIDWDDEFVIVITDKDNNIIVDLNGVYIFWIEDKIDYVFRNIFNYVPIKFNEF